MSEMQNTVSGKKNAIVYHDSCLDGFISGMIAFYKAVFFDVKNVVMIPANYSDKVLDVTDLESITLVDFSYSMNVLSDIAFKGIDVTVVDHHKTFIDSFLQYDDSLQHRSVMETTWPEREQDHVLKYHPVNGRPLFADVSVMNRNGRDTKFEFYLNNNEVKDKTSEFVHSGASLCFHIVTAKDMPREFKDWMDSQTNGEIEKTVRLARFHDLWLHKGDEMSHAYRLSHWFKKFHKDNKELIDQMKNDLGSSKAFFTQMVEKFNSVSLATKLEEARVDLETINDKLEQLANSPAIKTVEIKHGLHPVGGKVCYVDSPDVRGLGISIVGSYMTRKKGWDVAIMDAVVDDDKHVYSLRSNEEGNNVDVSYICQAFEHKGVALKGGGHSNAAGVSFTKDKKDEFFKVNDGSDTELVTLNLNKELHKSIEQLAAMKNLTPEECVLEVLQNASRETPYYSDAYRQELDSKNCMQCAVAYLLGLSLEEVPNFAESNDAAVCWDLFTDFISEKGYDSVMMNGNVQPEAYYLASGPTVRNTTHMVVMHDGKLIFDPHPSEAGLTSVVCIYLVAKRPPSTLIC